MAGPLDSRITLDKPVTMHEISPMFRGIASAVRASRRATPKGTPWRKREGKDDSLE